MNRKILVTGGAGFIGSHVNKILHESGYQTVILDNLSRGDRRSVIYGTFVKGDVGDPETLDKLFTEHQFYGVVHLAAWIDVGESVQNPAIYYQNNVINTLVLLETMRKYEVKNFIFSSTAALYGIPPFDVVTEDLPLSPLNPYGTTKEIIELALADYEKAYGLSWISLRYFNAAGGDPEGKIKNYKMKESNLIPLILKGIKKGNPHIKVFGTDYDTEDGTCIRDYIHVCDLGQAHLAALKHLLESGNSGIYNLGNGKGYSVKEVINAAEKVTGVKLNVEEVERREGDSPVLIANSEKAAKELHWKPKYDNLETIINHAWQAILL